MTEPPAVTGRITLYTYDDGAGALQVVDDDGSDTIIIDAESVQALMHVVGLVSRAHGTLTVSETAGEV